MLKKFVALLLPLLPCVVAFGSGSEEEHNSFEQENKFRSAWSDGSGSTDSLDYVTMFRKNTFNTNYKYCFDYEGLVGQICLREFDRSLGSIRVPDGFKVELTKGSGCRDLIIEEKDSGKSCKYLTLLDDVAKFDGLDNELNHAVITKYDKDATPYVYFTDYDSNGKINRARAWSPAVHDGNAYWDGDGRADGFVTVNRNDMKDFDSEEGWPTQLCMQANTKVTFFDEAIDYGISSAFTATVDYCAYIEDLYDDNGDSWTGRVVAVLIEAYDPTTAQTWTDVTGSWASLATSTNPQTLTWSYGTSVTNTESSYEEFTDSWYGSFSVGFTYQPPELTGGAGVQVSTTWGGSESSKVASTITTAFQTDTTVSTSITCPSDAQHGEDTSATWELYQFQASATETNSGTTATTASNSFRCVPADGDQSSMYCPPGYNWDDTNQACEE